MKNRRYQQPLRLRMHVPPLHAGACLCGSRGIPRTLPAAREHPGTGAPATGRHLLTRTFRARPPSVYAGPFGSRSRTVGDCAPGSVDRPGGLDATRRREASLPRSEAGEGSWRWRRRHGSPDLSSRRAIRWWRAGLGAKRGACVACAQSVHGGWKAWKANVVKRRHRGG